MFRKYKSILFIVVIFILCFTVQSCVLKKQRQETASEYPHPPESVKAVVKNLSLDGCTWIFELENGKKLQPVNLSSEFQKDNLNVWITYELKKGAVGVCMTGAIINIKTIGLR